jgi:hypothetical protein
MSTLTEWDFDIPRDNRFHDPFEKEITMSTQPGIDDLTKTIAEELGICGILCRSNWSGDFLLVFDALLASRRELKRVREALTVIDMVRNHIVATQNVNWSCDIYSLVKALGEAGYEGMGHEAAKAVSQELCEKLYAFMERKPTEAALAPSRGQGGNEK